MCARIASIIAMQKVALAPALRVENKFSSLMLVRFHDYLYNCKESQPVKRFPFLMIIL